MANLKKALLLGVLGATAAAGLAGFFLLGGSPARLAVDGGLALAQLVVILVMLSPTEKRVEKMVDALRALSRGDRHQRVNPDEFAGLSEVARALNEVAASLTEHDDPNLGPVKSVPRPRGGVAGAAAEAAIVAGSKPLPASYDTRDDRSVGPVRKLKKDPPPAQSAEPAPEPPKAASAPPVERPGSAQAGSARPPSGRPEVAAPTNDTNIDEHAGPAAESGQGGDSSAQGAPASADEPAALPTRAELDALFSEFVSAKKAHGEGVADLEPEAFVQTIMGECERLLAAHRCKGVKFEITMQDGEVSLRPRLLR